MPRVLIVEDEVAIASLVESYLLAEGFAVDVAADGVHGLQLFERYQPSVVILDIMLPNMSGLDLLQRIRAISEAYVIMLTAKSEEVDRILGLTMGADDYLTKPFSPRELVVRVKTILRRQRDPNQRFLHCWFNTHR